MWGRSNLQRAPAVGGQARPAAFAEHNGHSEDEDEHDGQGEAPWYETEIETLKSSLKALNMQMFQERKAWLAEKTELERAATGGAGSERALSSANSSLSGLGSMSTRRGIERSPALDRAAVGQGSEEANTLRAQLQAVTAERDAARKEIATLKQEAQKWNMEKATLQRELQIVRVNSTQAAGEDDERIAVLEEEKAGLASELAEIKESLKSNVLVSKERWANIQQFGSSKNLGSSSAQSPVSPAASTPKPSLPQSNSGNRLSSSGASTNNANNPTDSAAVIAKLQAENRRLAADLYIIRDECVPVPKAEFASLKGVHTEKAGLEQELRAVKQELADVTRLNKMLREEMELIKEEHMAITMQEYDVLRRAAAEKSALELKLEAQAKYYAQVPREELAELQSYRAKVVSLESKVAAMQATAAVGADEKARALQMSTDEAAELRVRVMELDNTCSELRKEIKAAEGRAQVITDLQDKLRLLELQLQSAQQEKARASIRLRALEEELEVAKRSLREAQAESAKLAVEIGSIRDANSSMAQELSQLSRERGELEAKVQEQSDDKETVTLELVEAKLELARLREMEVLYKKNLMMAKKQLYGTPSEAAT